MKAKACLSISDRIKGLTDQIKNKRGRSIKKMLVLDPTKRPGGLR
jgi:hypothetical protein